MNSEISKAIELLVGQEVTLAFAGVGSMMEIEFGNRLNDNEKPWIIWIQDSIWQIEKNNRKVIDNNFNNRAEFEKICRDFIGSRISKIVLETEVNVDFVFDNHMTICTKGTDVTDPDGICWEIFTPSDFVIGLGVDAKLYYVRSDLVE